MKKLFFALVFGTFLFVSFFALGVNAADPCTTEEGAATGTLAEGCINSKDFFINTNVLSPGGREGGGKFKQGNGSTDQTVNSVLSVVLENLMIVFGVLSLFIMTIGAGYMIFHSGEESLLSRGKTIFLYGIISLAVALSAGILVKLVAYLLY